MFILEQIKPFIFPFILGGTIISGSKYIATQLKNPALAAAFAALPTGLITIYFLSASDSLKYSKNYFFITLILLFSIAVFYLINNYTEINKNIILSICLSIWLLMVIIHFLIQKKITK